MFSSQEDLIFKLKDLDFRALKYNRNIDFDRSISFPSIYKAKDMQQFAIFLSFHEI